MRISDWSSDVCSSDLLQVDILHRFAGALNHREIAAGRRVHVGDGMGDAVDPPRLFRAGLLDLVELPGHGVDRLDDPIEYGAGLADQGDTGFHLLAGLLDDGADVLRGKSEEHTSELQSLMRISYAVFCLKK